MDGGLSRQLSIKADARRGAGPPAEVQERCAADAALLDLLQALDASGYDFVTPTPATHARVLARFGSRRGACPRDILGWSLPFRISDGPPDLVRRLRAANVLEERDGQGSSRIRVSRLEGRLFVHSAYPTQAADAVFLGPDSYRFAAFIAREVSPTFRGRAVDLGGGCGPGGLTLAGLAPGAEVILTDVNPLALRYARASAGNSGLAITALQVEGLTAVAPGVDLVIANPPYMAASEQTYRDGGAMQGAGLSLDWARQALERLNPGGRMLLYTGSAITRGGVDRLRAALADLCRRHGARLSYREIDPDVFGEELERPAYADVERIAAIGCVITAAARGRDVL
jgi:methylase of polypeptide subunit release factors